MAILVRTARAAEVRHRLAAWAEGEIACEFRTVCCPGSSLLRGNTVLFREPALRPPQYLSYAGHGFPNSETSGVVSCGTSSSGFLKRFQGLEEVRSSGLGGLGELSYGRLSTCVLLFVNVSRTLRTISRHRAGLHRVGIWQVACRIRHSLRFTAGSMSSTWKPPHHSVGLASCAAFRECDL